MAHSPVLKRLSAALHVAYDGITNAPVPERWVHLIKRLNEQERAERKASQAHTNSPRKHQASQ
jgi:hypothetical protein